MEKIAHWTHGNAGKFIYAISSGFTTQLELQMQREGISRTELASKLDKSTGRVSQVFNNPGNLSVRLMVEYARALGMKVSIVAYNDGDPDNTKGPINPEVFVRSWERLNRPSDLLEIEEEVPQFNFLTNVGAHINEQHLLVGEIAGLTNLPSETKFQPQSWDLANYVNAANAQPELYPGRGNVTNQPQLHRGEA